MRLKGRFLVMAATAFLTLAISSVALAAGSVVGKYSTTVNAPAQLKGKWVVTFTKGGTYKVSHNGNTLARGTYTTTATTITLREPDGCGGTGTYAWKKSGKTLTFVRKRESPACGARAAVLTHRFTRVG
jgi:hypothetical protein